ncbi:hypothetical protein H4Q26_012710 [Puccinia striiformis f. sp. tritici PST-130]|uniref:Uncharacterized protein n=1 Tax=Puccinia striiformis f. sp. tritici PST-78 TaxID=1165861 RepID=A0A0L0VUT1_9BASI|nr:hypothetical protein H4Q26_012710 [Puccinia striiformis f. sp. tritici PST-130]KNF02775.1 hypothetical protein PSTG_04060 [Puccinia striiformis f. sp. tritici PST-78]
MAQPTELTLDKKSNQLKSSPKTKSTNRPSISPSKKIYNPPSSSALSFLIEPSLLFLTTPPIRSLDLSDLLLQVTDPQHFLLSSKPLRLLANHFRLSINRSRLFSNQSLSNEFLESIGETLSSTNTSQFPSFGLPFVIQD